MDTIVEYVESIQEQVQRSELEVMIEMANVYMRFADTLARCTLESDVEMEVFGLVQETDRVPKDAVPAQQTADGKSKQPTKASKKLGMIGKIVNMIKKVFSFIGGVLKKLFAWIGGLFKRKAKSADQIAEEVGIKPNPSMEEKAKTSTRSGKLTAPPQTAPISAAGSGSKTSSVKSTSAPTAGSSAQVSKKSVSISFPVEVVDDKTGSSQKKTYDAEAIFKDLSIKLNQDGTFSWNMNGAVHNYNTRDLQSHPWNSPSKQPQNPMWAIAILQNLGWFTKYHDLVLEFINGDIPKMYNQNGTSGLTEWRTKINQTMNQLNSMSFGNLTFERGEGGKIKYSTLVSAQKVLNQLNEMVGQRITNDWQDSVVIGSKVYGTAIPEGVTDEDLNRIFECLKKVYDFLAVIQYSFTITSALFNTVYDVDARYAESVSDPETLDNFVAQCISTGMPSKNIFRNIAILATPELRGPAVKVGQTRAIIFPENMPDVVYKYAINGVGISANEAERTISHKVFDTAVFASTDMPKYFAKVVGNLNHRSTAISMERAEFPGTFQDRTNHKDEIVENINRILGENNLFDAFEFSVNDLHGDNVGVLPRTGGWALIDYGNIARSTVHDPFKAKRAALKNNQK